MIEEWADDTYLAEAPGSGYAFDVYLVEEADQIAECREHLEVEPGCEVESGGVTIRHGYHNGRPCVQVHVPGEGLWVHIAN